MLERPGLTENYYNDVTTGDYYTNKLNLGSPVIFKQQRPGLNEKIFTLYKFSTMTDERDENGELLPNHADNEVWKNSRSTSLDELPELFNVLKGDMAIIGPRPLLVEYLPLYDEHQGHRHDVRPGLSGLAQVNGRNSISWNEKFELDIKYIKYKLRNDLKIILLTLKGLIEKASAR